MYGFQDLECVFITTTTIYIKTLLIAECLLFTTLYVASNSYFVHLRIELLFADGSDP